MTVSPTRRTSSPRRANTGPLPGTASTTTRVAAYLRASTDEENQPYTLGMQEEKVRAYVASQDDMELVTLYSERASAKDIEGRPELLRLLEDAATDKFDTVIVYKVDRWSRRLADLLATVDFLDRHHVAFASVTEPIDTTTNLGKMVLQILGSFAEFERGLIVERVTRGIEAKLGKGLPLTSAVGFGLRVNAQGVVEKDPATFAVVERIFTAYTTKQLGTKAIATALQEDGLPTPGSSPWGPPAVARVLRNRTFIGELPFRDGWVNGAHDPLLDVELFEKAQRLADKRSTQRAAAQSRGDFLLSGTIVCGSCGAAYAGTTGTSSNGTKVRYYTCTTMRRYGKAQCAAPSVPSEELENLVTDALVATYADSDIFEAAVTAHLAATEDQAGPLSAELTVAETTAAATDRKLARYRDDYEAERIAGDTYQEAKGRLEEQLLKLRGRIALLQLELAGHDLASMPTEADRKALHATLVERVRTGSVPVRKAMFNALVERLEVHALDDIRPTFRLGGPKLPNLPDAAEAAGQDPDRAPAGEMFASRAPGWS